MRSHPENQMPWVLVSAATERSGPDQSERATHLPEAYQTALLEAGGIPLAMPGTVSRPVIAACVDACDGVLLTGGEDVDPRIYGPKLRPELRRKVTTTPDGGRRDYREMVLIAETLRQRKPLLAICRGQQVLNVALGGTLWADLPTQLPTALNHRRMDLRREVVHEVRLTPGSILAKITGRLTLGVNSTHHQAVRRVAPPLRVTAASPDGIVEGLEWKAGAGEPVPFVVSVQFHPERLVDRYPEHQAIFRAFVQACVLSRNLRL